MGRYLRDIEITSSNINRSGLVTKNMTSATPDKEVGTMFKSVLVDENGEFVVGNEAPIQIQADWAQTDSGELDFIKNKPIVQYPTTGDFPATGESNTIYISQDTDVVYRWDSLTLTYIPVSSGGSDAGIRYSLSDGTLILLTIGDRALASTGTAADKTYETSQEIDPLTGNTTSQTFTGTVNYDGATITSENSTYNHTGDTVNNDATTQINNTGTEINNNGTVENNTDVEENYNSGSITNNNGNTVNNTGVTENYDSTSVTNNDGNTINNTGITENWDGDSIVNLAEGDSITNNYDGEVNNNLGDTYVENNSYEDGATVNYDGNVDNNYTDYTENNVYSGDTVINNTSTPVLLGCTSSPAFDSAITPETDSQYALVTIGADEYKVLVDTDQTLIGSDYIVSATWSGGDLTLTVDDGSPTLNDVCWYNGVMITNNENNIVNNDGDIINNTNITENYSESNVTYDETTNVTYEGETNISNLNVENITYESGGNVLMNGVWEYEETPLNASTYVLTNTPVSAKSFMVFVDSGTGLFPTTDYTYDVATNTITFSPQLGTSEKAIVWVMKGTSTTASTEETEEFTGDDTTTDFTLANTYVAGAKVYINGLRQKTTNYSVTGTTLSFVTAPLLDDEILIDYIY